MILKIVIKNWFSETFKITSSKQMTGKAEFFSDFLMLMPYGQSSFFGFSLLILKSYGLIWLIARAYIQYKHLPLNIILHFDTNF